MDWRQAMEGERAALMRVVALLHALAGLAERAEAATHARLVKAARFILQSSWRL